MKLVLSSIGLALAALVPGVLAQAGDPSEGAVAHGEQQTKIRLLYAEFDPRLGTPSVPFLLSAGADTRLYIVQFRDLPRDEDRGAVAATGATLHSYLPDNAYVVRMPAETAFRVSQLPSVRFVGHYEPAYRLEPTLRHELLRESTLPTRKYNIVVVDKHGDKPALAARIAGIGGRVDHLQPGSVLLEASLSGEQLLQVARMDEVLWIDRWSAPELDMNNARIQGGGNYVESSGGYTGAGIRAHVYEGIETTHQDFVGNVPINVLSCGAAQDHGHCTAGIIAGKGNSHASARGMAPNAQLYYSTYTCINAGLSRWQVLQNVATTQQCLQTTASWGNARTTAYTSISADTDDIIFDHDLPWTQSQSNAGNPMSRPEAWAKNVTSIGGVQHFDNSNPADDSWAAGGASTGPAADGRIKPDLCAYYDSIWTSDLTGAAGYASTNYFTGFNGTSGATPIVNGHMALAQQMFTNGIFNNPLRVPGGTRYQNRGHAPTTKALMIATAAQYAFQAANNRREHQGWGFPDLRSMYDSRNRMFIVDETDVLLQGQTKTYSIVVAAGTPSLKVALSWIEPMANPAAAFTLINDLDLTVTSPSGVVYRGNVGLKSGTTSTAGGVADNRDSVECVFVDSPASGTWRVDVFARLVAQDNHLETTAVDADYGLVVNGGRPSTICGFHVPDADPTVGTCNVIPFGDNSTTWENQKYQTIVRAADLGNRPSTITGIAFAPCGSGTRSHATILVRMSHVPAGYAMTTNFGTNLPAPVTVLNSRNYHWTNNANDWNEIGLMNYFSYDGIRDVVVEVTLTGNRFTGTTQGMHRDVRERLQAFGWVGSPPATGTLDSAALKMRLDDRCANLHTYGRGCANLEMQTSGTPTLGSSYKISAVGGRPSSPIWLNAGFNNQLPTYPWDLGVFGYTGCSFYHDIVVTLATSTAANGDAVLTFGVPSTPNFLGAKIYWQWVQLNPVAPGGAAFSGYARAVYGD